MGRGAFHRLPSIGSTDAMDETVRMAKRYDQKEVPDDDEEEGYPSMASFVLPEEAYDGLYDSVTEANELAKQFVEMQLEMPLNCEIARQEQVANGELPHGYQLPTADTVAKEMARARMDAPPTRALCLSSATRTALTCGRFAWRRSPCVSSLRAIGLRFCAQQRHRRQPPRTRPARRSSP